MLMSSEDRTMLRKWILGVFAALAVAPIAVSAGERVLSINGNAQNDVWFISGEPSMVLNGFDLNSFGVQQPATIDRVSIAVHTPVPGQPIDVVIYQDANGGSPADATVAGRTTVDITQAGVFTAEFNPAITVTAPAVWVGFYLPVDFKFLSDTSGPSVLTYWAWTPGGRFDPANLGSASVLGPADGSAPVSITMTGKARITLEITGANGSTSAEATPSAPIVRQQPGAANANLAVLVAYPNCGAVLFDTGDEVVTWGDSINPQCREVPDWQSPAAPQGYTRRGVLYDLFFYKSSGLIPGRLDYEVTHCIRPAAEDLNTALIGLAYGAPRQWRILPTERFGDLVCAEVRHGGNLSIFLPPA